MRRSKDDSQKTKKEKDVIDLMLDQLDFHGMTKDELTGKDGLLRQLTSRFYERILNAEMDEYLGYKKHDNDQIISMYSYGMSCRDIQRHLQEVYGVTVSADLIPHVTEAVMLDA